MNSDVSFDLHCHPSSRDLNESLADGELADGDYVNLFGNLVYCTHIMQMKVAAFTATPP